MREREEEGLEGGREGRGLVRVRNARKGKERVKERERAGEVRR